MTDLTMEDVLNFLTEDNWTKGAYARNEKGSSVSVLSPEAKKFCIIGAIIKITENDYKKFNNLVEKYLPYPLTDLNDTAKNVVELKSTIRNLVSK